MLKESSKVEQRYDAVVAVIRDGFKITEVAEKFGVHRDTSYAWLAPYEEAGLEGLAGAIPSTEDLSFADVRSH